MASTGETWRLGRRPALVAGVVVLALVLMAAARLSSAQPTKALAEWLPGRPVMATFSNTDMRARVLTPRPGGALAALPGSAPFADPDPAVGVRDPSLARVGGRYVLAYTRAPKADFLGHESTWGLAVSGDLRSFTRLAVVTPRLPGGLYTIWAPDLLVDGGTVYCYWTGATKAGGTHQTYVQHASVDDLADWSRPTLVRGLGSNALDLTVVRDGAGYVGVVKDENVSRLHLARASNPLGPFATDADPLPTGSDRVEGPALVHLRDGRWVLAFDPFQTDHLAFMTSSDLSQWSSPARVAAPAGLRHPSLLWFD